MLWCLPRRFRDLSTRQALIRLGKYVFFGLLIAIVIESLLEDDISLDPFAGLQLDPVGTKYRSRGETLENILNDLDCNNPATYNGTEARSRMATFLKETTVIERTQDCDRYFNVMKTVAFEPTTNEEKAFPLAFAFTTHNNIGILETFLALYFRPTDSHCVHIDDKASPYTHRQDNTVVLP